MKIVPTGSVLWIEPGSLMRYNKKYEGGVFCEGRNASHSYEPDDKGGALYISE